MAYSDNDLKEKLIEAGNKLADPPSSVEELLSLLDQVGGLLFMVEQTPTHSMQNALFPSLKALIADELLSHSDVDVKVAVASCISEITRITAPDAPFDDDLMKEVFQLIISSFENLYDKSSLSYAKRTSILEVVAKVRSCMVMLDLECDGLILEMFQHFLKEIREHHPENVFSSMETIMTVVLEESEDIPLDLLSPLLVSIRKDNEEVLPIARKLGERVLQSCATKLKPYLVQAVKTLGVSVEDYSSVLSSICQDASDSLEQNDEDENKLTKQLLEESKQKVKEDAREVAPSQQDNPVGDGSPKSVVSNGIAQVGEDDTSADPKSLKKLNNAGCSDQSKLMNISGHKAPNNIDTKKADNSERKQEKATKRRGKKSNSSVKSTKPSEDQAVANEKEAEKKLGSESHGKEVPRSPHENHSVEVAGPLENDTEINDEISSPKTGNNESEVVASPSPNESLNYENHSKKIGQGETKDGSANVVAVEAAKVFDGTCGSEAKPARWSGKKPLVWNSDVKKTHMPDSIKKGSAATSVPDAANPSAKKVDDSNKVGGGSSSRQPGDKKKRGQVKADSQTVVVKDVDKEIGSSPRSSTKSTKDENSEDTPKTNVKRKHTLGKENESDTKEYGQNIVGLRVKVWWPKDREFYKGVIDCFDSAKMKHKVMYDDGDEELLNLRKEKWKLVTDDSDSDQEEGSDRASLDASTDMPPKKKGKTSAGESIKQGKRDVSSKSGKAAASSRSKGTSSKFSQKSKDISKSKDFKTISKSEDEVGKKSNAPKSVGNRSVAAAAQKMTSKTKDTDTSNTSKSKGDNKQETPKSGKSKQETPKTAASKVKSSRGGGKSNVNGSGKVKSSLLKRKDLENEKSDVSAGETEDTKGKTPSSSKAQGSDAKSGKKRRKR